MIVSFNSIKGGAGKSTLAVNFAVWLTKLGHDVLVVDGDDQETASDFTAWREVTLNGEVGYTLVNLTGPNLRKQVELLRPKYDYVIIDTGGRDTTSQRAALSIADVSLIPFVPRSFDLWTIHKVVTLVNEIQSIRGVPLEVFTFLSRADLRSADNRDVAESLSEFKEFRYLDTPIINRKAISNATSKGLGVFELAERDLKAEKELESLFKKIIDGRDTTDS